MPVLTTSVDPRSRGYLEQRSAMLERLDELAAAVEQARTGGGQRQATRHHARGKLLARERIELLVDRDAPLLELSPVAGWGTQYPVGAAIVTAVGFVEGVPCVITANDPTVRGGAVNPYTVKKARRAAEIAWTNRLPLVNLVESAGPDLPGPADPLVPDLATGREMSRLSASGIPTIAVVFGDAASGAAFVLGLSDYTVFVRDKARVLLAGRPPGRPTAGDVSTGGFPPSQFIPTGDFPVAGAAATTAVGVASVGGTPGGSGPNGVVPPRPAPTWQPPAGAVPPGAVSGGGSELADFVAEDERDAIRLARSTVARLNRPPLCPAPRPVEPPRYDPAELLAAASVDRSMPFEPREVLARVLDGSRFDEFRPGYGAGLCAGWGTLHGYPVAVLANAHAPIGCTEARKATQFIQLADASATPLLFLRDDCGFSADGGRGTPAAHATPYPAAHASPYPAAHATPYPAAHGEAVRYAATMLNALTNSRVPHLLVNTGGGCGAGEDLLGGPAYRPTFLFTWPNAHSAVGSAQLAGLLSAARQAAEAAGQGYDEAADASMRATVEYRVGQESTALFRSGRLYDDGVIDPRDTRTVLGLCLAVIASGGDAGTASGGLGTVGRARPVYGVFRM